MNEPSPLFGELLLRLGLVTERQLEEALALQKLTDQRVGEVLVTLGYVTREQLQAALLEEIGLSGEGPTAKPHLFGELMVRLKHVRREQVDRALELQRRSGQRLGEALVELGFCTYKQVYEALALQQRGPQPPGPNAAESVHAEGQPAPSGDPGPEPAANPGSQVKVVVVDDSPIASAMVEMGLTQLGYAVTVFTDPLVALEQIPRLKPSIVLSDLEMPGMNGNDLCRRLKDGPARNIPVIILTANDADAQRVRGLRAGADDYVSKSASLEEIAARIESVVRRVGETERMRRLFARYTSDAVVEEILKNPGEVVLTGEKREVTVLFADLRNFTGISETLPPEEVVAMLNEVLGPLSDAVLTCGGTLDKFLGDGLMAVFGAPVSRSDDAQRALQAACSMMEALRVLNEKRARDAQARGQTALQLRLGIGINSGPAVAGNFGSAVRTEYTCIGDTVNVAARLCAVAEGGEILVGERTRELVGSGGRFEELEPVKLKGKAQPVPLFRALWGNPNREPRAAPELSNGSV